MSDKTLWKIITRLLCYLILVLLVTWYSHNHYFFLFLAQNLTKQPRWPWITHLIFWDCSSQFFFVTFRIELTRISLCLYSARSLHLLIPCLLTDKNFKNNSEKSHSRNISMRLFQNLTNSFREDFLWFCLCSYSQVAPIHQSLVHGQIKISITFLRGHSRNISVNWE